MSFKCRILIKQNYLLLWSMIILTTCQSDQSQNTNNPDNPVDSFESALPHGKPLPDLELSDADKLKLAMASGREAFPISPDSLSAIIDTDSVGLIIFNFWNPDCKACYQNIENLGNLKYGSEEMLDFELIHINTDTLYPEMVNSIIREKDIIDPVFTIYNNNISDWTSMIYSSWDGQLPAVLIINKEDGTKLFYQKAFNLEELHAVLLPLTF